jgi:hypothetical protein
MPTFILLEIKYSQLLRGSSIGKKKNLEIFLTKECWHFKLLSNLRGKPTFILLINNYWFPKSIRNYDLGAGDIALKKPTRLCPHRHHITEKKAGNKHKHKEKNVLGVRNATKGKTGWKR